MSTTITKTTEREWIRKQLEAAFASIEGWHQYENDLAPQNRCCLVDAWEYPLKAYGENAALELHRIVHGDFIPAERCWRPNRTTVDVSFVSEYDDFYISEGGALDRYPDIQTALAACRELIKDDGWIAAIDDTITAGPT